MNEELDQGNIPTRGRHTKRSNAAFRVGGSDDGWKESSHSVQLVKPYCYHFFFFVL